MEKYETRTIEFDLMSEFVSSLNEEYKNGWEYVETLWKKKPNPTATYTNMYRCLFKKCE